MNQIKMHTILFRVLDPSMKFEPFAFVVVLGVAACAGPSGRWAAECRTPEARFAALGIASSDIIRIDSVADRGEGGIISRHGWARLKSCTGYVVVRLDSACDHSDPYTTGDCRLPQGRSI